MVICKVADNIISPLGSDTNANFDSIKNGMTALKVHEKNWELPEPFMASLFSDGQRKSIIKDGYSFYESLVIESVTKTLEQYPINIESKRVVLVLSTTKADIELITDETKHIKDFPTPGDAANKIAKKLGISTLPITACNACISGVAAISIASRLLAQGAYDYAIVSGCDCLSDFVVSGFQSLKALSPEMCKPFDIERLGLNLGESVATMLLEAKKETDNTISTWWKINSSAIRNDAYHISSPSKRAEGCYRAIKSTIEDEAIEDISLLNVHGTATMYNDQMESVAVERSGLSQVPANGLKGFFGHTMGASGILESILSMYSLDHDLILATHGFNEIGVSGKINISNENRTYKKSNDPSVLKIISGFGGCNGAVLYDKKSTNYRLMPEKPQYEIKQHVILRNESVTINNENISITHSGKELLTELYHKYAGDYPKFYKMDMLAKLGFIASELLINAENKTRFDECENRAIVLFNHSSSVISDVEFEKSIIERSNYFPSPSVFVYTLPNIVAGEIAIRNKYLGETSFYVLPSKDENIMHQIISASFADANTTSIISGWLECDNEDTFEADFTIFELNKR